MAQPKYSFELFPPKTDKGREKLDNAVKSLNTLKPRFMSVTYGAGGSESNGTFDTLIRVSKQSPTPLACHLTFISAEKPELHKFAEQLWANNIRSIVALRGDMPPGKSYKDFLNDRYYDYTNNFILGLKALHDFDISVGAYPEKHPDSACNDMDLQTLKYKMDAGANRALTQFFFDNNHLYDFIERARANGIKGEITPGILPIRDFENMMSFAKKCRASVPQSLVKKFEQYSGDSLSQRQVAQDFLNHQLADLAANGIDSMHFYCLNDDSMILEACQGLTVKKP